CVIVAQREQLRGGKAIVPAPTEDEDVAREGEGLAILLGADAKQTGFIRVSGQGPWKLVPITEGRSNDDTANRTKLGLQDLADGIQNCDFQFLFREWREPLAMWLKIARGLVRVEKTLIAIASGGNTVAAMRAPGWRLFGARKFRRKSR